MLTVSSSPTTLTQTGAMPASSSSSQAAAQANTRRRGQRVQDTGEDVVVVQDHEGRPLALVPARGVGISLSQMKAATNVNPALLVALKGRDGRDEDHASAPLLRSHDDR